MIERYDTPADPLLPISGASRRSRRELLRLGAGVAAALLFVRCGGDEEPIAVATEEPSGPLELAEWPLPLAGPRTGRLRLGVLGPRDPTDDALPPEALPFVYACLIAVDPRDGAVYSDLAREVEVDAEALTVRFWLRPAMHFHPDRDGLAAALTAEEVRLDFERRRDAREFLFTEVIATVEAPEPEQLVLRLRAPFSLLFEYLGDPSRAGVRHDGRYATHNARLGSGPFMPAIREAAGDLLVASLLYHRAPLPRLDSVALLRVDDEAARADGFARGQLDLLPGVGAGGAPALAGARRVQRASRRMRGLGLSLLPEKGGVPVRWVEAFQDARVRRAVSHALDRDALAAVGDGALSGPAGPAWGADALSAETLARHPLLAFDPPAARALLAEAGHEGLAFRLEAPLLDGMEELGGLVLAQLERAGFRPELVLRDPVEWRRSFLAGDFEATLFELEALDTPELGLRLHTAGGADGRFSPWGYSSPMYDAAVRRVLAELTPAGRARRSRAAQRLLLEQVPAMFPLLAPYERMELAPGLERYEWDSYEFNERHLGALWGVSAPPSAKVRSR
jgi:peptide/nickel transport system substrate-binding protein